MKRLSTFGILLAVVTAFGLAGSVRVAIGETTPVTLAVEEVGSDQGDVSGAPGSVITMNVVVSNAAAVAGIDWDLLYDPAVLEVTALPPGNPPSGFQPMTNPVNTPASFPSSSGVVGAASANSQASGVAEFVMLGIDFRLIGQPGQRSELTFQGVVVGDEGDPSAAPPVLPGRLDTVEINGSITVRSQDEVVLAAVDPVTGSSTITGQIGGQVVVRYVAQNAAAVAGFQFTNRFDKSLVHVPGERDGVNFGVNNLPGSFTLEAGVRNAEGEVSIAGASAIDSGVPTAIIADVTYDLSPAPGPLSHGDNGAVPCAPLVFDDVVIGDANVNTLPFSTVDGEICFVAPKEPDPGIDLSITKTDSSDPVVAGTQLTYTLTVTNNGTETATGVRVVDDLPTPTGFVSADAGCGYDNDSHSVTCDIGDLAHGASVDRELTVDISSDVNDQTVITNTASTTSNENDINSNDNTVSEDTTVGHEADSSPDIDLSITKTDSSDPVVAGTQLTYTLTVTNNGTETATGVRVVDNLPTPAGFVSADAGCGYDIGNHNVTCDTGDLAAGASVDRQITVDIGSDLAHQTVITNTASATSNEDDINPNDNTVSENTTVGREADVAVVKTDTPDPVRKGGTLTYSIDVTNNGPSDATAIIVTDTLPAGLSNVTFALTLPAPGTPHCPLAGSVLTCNLGDLAAGSSLQVVITGTVDAQVGATLTSTATVDANEFDPNGNNNTATEDTTVRAPDINLSITKTDSSDPVVAGTQLTYTLTVTNNGTETATGVRVVDNLPTPAGFVSADAGCGYDIGSHNVTCDTGDLAAGASVDRQITVDIGSDLAHQTVITNTASATSNEDDINPNDNTVSENTTVGREADVAVVKTDTPDPVPHGGTLTYSIDVTNNGPSDATAIIVTDTLPAGLTNVAYTPGDPDCALTGGVLTCNLGDLAAGSSVQVVITGTVDAQAGTTLTNTATVDANEFDPNGSNDTATEDTTVAAPGPEVSIPSNIPALFGGPVAVPIDFVSNGHSIAAIGFQIEFNDTCLSIDFNDSDFDGIPDGITNLVPGAWAPIVFLQPGTTNRISMAWSDNSPPFSALPDLTVATMNFIADGPPCDPGISGSIVTPITFSTNPVVSFGDPGGQDVPGTSVDGSVEIIGGIRGDCNGSGSVTAADFTAVVLEFFDGDDNNDLSDVPNGTFQGSPVGCDANDSGSVTIADVTCTVLIFFGLECGGGQAVSARLIERPLDQPMDSEPVFVSMNLRGTNGRIERG